MKKSKIVFVGFIGRYALIEPYTIYELILEVDTSDNYLYNRICPTPHRTPSLLVVFILF